MESEAACASKQELQAGTDALRASVKDLEAQVCALTEARSQRRLHAGASEVCSCVPNQQSIQATAISREEQAQRARSISVLPPRFAYQDEKRIPYWRFTSACAGGFSKGGCREELWRSCSRGGSRDREAAHGGGAGAHSRCSCGSQGRGCPAGGTPLP